MDPRSGRRLVDPPVLAFPFRVGATGPQLASRAERVRQEIEQVLYTDPTERVFRPELGAGVRRLVFEPNVSALWEVANKRLTASLAEALRGEVDPRTLRVEVSGEEERLVARVSYTLATVDRKEEHRFRLGPGGGGGG